MGITTKGGNCLVCEYIKRLYTVVKSALHMYQTEGNSKKNTPVGNLGSTWAPTILGTNVLNYTFGQSGIPYGK